MSKMVPRETIDALRHQVNVSLDNYGIDCHLFIPTTTSYNTAENLDVFATPSDLTFIEYETTVFVEWGVSVYRLKKLGLYVEDMIPIIAHFGTTAKPVDGSDAGSVVNVDICKGSYFTITPEYIPNNYVGSDAFEIINEAIRGMHDAVITRVYSIVPRRVQGE